MPEVSVIIPTYNRAKFIGRAIDSVLAQTYEDYEIIVIDDGSTDNTRKLLTSYGNNIKYKYQENAGVSATRNTGIRAASGQWIAFLDSDDIWLPHKLSTQVECVSNTGTKVCFTNVELVEEKRNVSKFDQREPKVFQDPFELILQDSLVLYVQSLLVDRSLIQRLGGYDERLRLAEDTGLIYNLAFETPFAYIHAPLVRIDRTNQRKGLINIDHNPNARRALCQAHIEIISQAYFRCGKKRNSVMKRLRHMLAHFLSLRAVMYCVDRNYSDARRSAKDAMRFGGKFRTYRRGILVLLFPWLVGWLRKKAWR